MTVQLAMLDAQSPEEVLERVKNSGSSFLLGMLAVPKARRQAMFGVYAFCRAVDDIADSSWSDSKRLAELQEWRAHVEKLFAGQASHP
ncbi:MAG TPA: squalene/phytoene synthase family protein, partial [Alphaproteobacteria bacterium]|nr:squalene/phytoene synthase family protein [Alphaproteobacteria bacterium]